jgi:hypothetical protein
MNHDGAIFALLIFGGFFASMLALYQLIGCIQRRGALDREFAQFCRDSHEEFEEWRAARHGNPHHDDSTL